VYQDYADVYQTVALSVAEGKPISPTLARLRNQFDHLHRVDGVRVVPEQLTAARAARLRDHRGGGEELAVDLEGLDERTVQVARLLIDGHTAGQVQELLGMGRREFEVRRETLRELFA